MFSSKLMIVAIAALALSADAALENKRLLERRSTSHRTRELKKGKNGKNTKNSEAKVRAYKFESRFEDDVSSVSYSGQTARQLLISLQKAAIGDVIFAEGVGVAEGKVLRYFDCDDTTCETVATGVSVADPLVVSQDTVGDVSTGKNLVGKIAGNDITGQHKDWDTQFVGWNNWGPISPKSPENLVRNWAMDVDTLSNGDFLDPDGNPLTKAFVSPDGQDYQQLIQKFVLGAVAFSQGADDYLDDDTEGKGLKAQNSVIAKDGKPYTSLEHNWDEGFGYFGAAINYYKYTDDEIAKKGGRPEFSGSYNDYDEDGFIDLRSEKNYGHSLNAAKRDRGASTDVDLSRDAYDAFYRGRKVITDAGGELSEEEMAKLLGYRDIAVGAWEKAIAATVIHYINDCIFDIAQTELDFYGYAKHWSEAKGFALSFQFNRLSPLSEADFGTLHSLLRDSPELVSAAFAAWTNDLLEARDLLEAAYGFDPSDVAGW